MEQRVQSFYNFKAYNIKILADIKPKNLEQVKNSHKSGP